ncbi:MAG: molybdopterin oxidoreductase family protein, partial [Rhodospirillaceae bacterium]|nr:molybdopterin oxidoreductase family protein [Rhodospirillaceae bacterium]
MTAWEIIDETLKLSGHKDAQSLYDARWEDCALDFETTHFLNGFGHTDGKFRFKPDWAAIGPDIDGLPPLPDYAPIVDLATVEHPLRLVTAPARQFLNSTFTMTPTSRQREE